MPAADSATRPRRRHRRSCSEEDEPMASWKIGLVIGVVVLCFAMLYPSLLHPMITSFLTKPPPRQPAHNRPPIHPSMSSPRTRPDIHPGMRMAAAQAEAHTASSSKGMFSWMLPLYTVGVVVFLVYTLVKSRRKKQRRRRAYSSEESDSCDEDESQQGISTHNLGRKKLRGLQERLKQTELAMSKILEQLGGITAEETVGGLQAVESPSASSENVQSNPSDEGNKGINPVDKDEYLRDLEKALREFKHLSSTYNREERRRRGESCSEEEEEGDEPEEEFDEDEGIEESAKNEGSCTESASEDEDKTDKHERICENEEDEQEEQDHVTKPRRRAKRT